MPPEAASAIREAVARHPIPGPGFRPMRAYEQPSASDPGAAHQAWEEWERMRAEHGRPLQVPGGDPWQTGCATRARGKRATKLSKLQRSILHFAADCNG